MLVIFRLAALLVWTGTQAGDQSLLHYTTLYYATLGDRSMLQPSMYMYLAWTLFLTVAMESMRTVRAWFYLTSISDGPLCQWLSTQFINWCHHMLLQGDFAWLHNAGLWRFTTTTLQPQANLASLCNEKLLGIAILGSLFCMAYMVATHRLMTWPTVVDTEYTI